MNELINKFNLRNNLEKIVIQKISRNPDINCIYLKGRQLKEVDKFSYLVSVVTRNGKIQNQIKKYLKSTTILSSCKGIIKKQLHTEMKTYYFKNLF